LPRYALDSVVASSEGHSVQNEPLPWGDAWILAPMDAPRMLCLARGSGDLRWQVGARTPSDLPPWRDLLGIVAGEDGAPVLRLSGEEGVLRIDPADGARYYDADEPWEVGEADPGGRVLDVGPYALRATNGGVQARPWQPSGDLDRDAPFFLTAEAGMPHAGDLVRAGRIWLVVGPEGVAALAQPGDVDDLLATGNEDEPALRATRLALHGRLQGDVRRVASAVEAARAVKGATLRGPVFAQVAAELLRAIEVLQGEDEELAGLRALAVVARTLPSAERGPALRTLARRFFVLDADDDGARLCLQWIASADDTLVPRARHWDPLRDDRLRGDLMAARLLRKHAARPAVAAVLAEYERSAADRFAALDPEDEPGLRAAIRRHVGTRAAARARRRLLARLVETRRFAAAAGVVAD
ncbi:MAG: hypothetical protein P1V36_10650, partial [Planctomycetota bacterium]|nr:hypothetical protein [Planctomycetota bacterium]